MNATATQIKNRKEAKDVFITPTDLAKKHIDIVKKILKYTIDCEEDCERTFLKKILDLNLRQS